MLTAEEKRSLEITQRSTELSAIIYHELIRRDYLDQTHLLMANRLGKLALVLAVAKETQTMLYDKSTTLVEQGAEMTVDALMSKLPAGIGITIKGIELFGNYAAPVIVEDVNSAVIQVAKTERDILEHLSEAQKIAWQTEFTLSEEMVQAVAWVKGCKYFAEKIGEAKKWIGKSAQKGVDYVSSAVQQAAEGAHDEELAGEFREANAIFKLANALSEKIKRKDPNNKVDEIAAQNYVLSDEELEATKSDTVVTHSSLFRQSKKSELAPKLSFVIAGGSSSGLAIIGKVTMGLTTISVGIGAAVLAVGLTVSHIYQKIKKKQFKHCQKLQAQNSHDARLTYENYNVIVDEYKAAYMFEDADKFEEVLIKINSSMEKLQTAIKTRFLVLEHRNKAIQGELKRKDYIAPGGHRQIYDELKALYGQISDSLQAITKEIQSNLEVLNAAKTRLIVTH